MVAGIRCEICRADTTMEPCGCTEQDHINMLRKELADLKAELANTTSLKNTYHDNWQDAKGTIDSQAEVINNLTNRWGKKCRELADLKTEYEKLNKKYENLEYPCYKDV